MKLAKLGSLFGVGSRVSRGQVLKERHRQDSGGAGHSHPGKRLDECQQYMARAAKLEIAKQAVVAAVAEQDRLRRVQHRFRKIGGAEEGGIGDVGGPRPRWRWMATRTESDNSKPWFQRLRREKGRFAIAQCNVEASGRGCGRPHNFDSRSLGRACLSGSRLHLRGCRWPWNEKM